MSDDHPPCAICGARHIAQHDRLIALEKGAILAHDLENALRLEIKEKQQTISRLLKVLTDHGIALEDLHHEAPRAP